MGVKTESQVFAECDRCSAYAMTSIHNQTEFKKYLRTVYGWSIGKETLCPECASEKRRLIQSERSRNNDR